jgi:opacity protein-like surface antigen
LHDGDSFFCVDEVTFRPNGQQARGEIMVSGKLAFANAVAAGALVLSFCTCAGAADLTRRPPPPLLQPIYLWNGFYVGGHVGGVTSSETATDISGFTASTDPSGVLGGVQAGYNYQVAPNWLVGIEGELSWTSASGGSSSVIHSDHNWYDTLDARLGYVMGPWLLYAKGGAAWMNADYSVAPFSTNVTRSGWNIGAGAEFMLAPQWSAKAEYNFLDFGKDNLGGLFSGIAVDTQVHEFKVGVNYHFVPGTLFGRW